MNVYVVFAFRDALTLPIDSPVHTGHVTPAGAFGVYWGATQSCIVQINWAMVMLLDGVNEPCRVSDLVLGFHWADTLDSVYELPLVSVALPVTVIW